MVIYEAKLVLDIQKCYPHFLRGLLCFAYDTALDFDGHYT